MRREDLKAKHLRVLALLELAWRERDVRTRREWVSSIELANGAGLRFGGRINEMDHVGKPERGLGFRIERSAQPKTSRNWYYRLVGYPADWEGPRAFPETQGRLFEAA